MIENIRLAYNNAQVGKYSGANEVFKDVIKNDLEKTYGTGNVIVDYSEQEQKYSIEITGKGLYEIQADGTVQKQGANIEVGTVTYVLKDSNNQIVSTPKIEGEGTVEIHFTPNLVGGTITDVTATAPEGLTISTPTLIGNEWVTTVSANGTYTFTIIGATQDGNKSVTNSVVINQFFKLPSGLQVGSVVNYAPIGATYNWDETFAGMGTYSFSIDSGENGNARITSWRVLDINANMGIVKLVPTNQTSTSAWVTLMGASGYNNAVYLLNDACKTLYTNPELGVNENDVRNINVEDIESAMNKNNAIAYAKGSNWPIQMQNASDYYKNNSNGYIDAGMKHYPLIYAKEQRAVINGQTNFGILYESEQNVLIAKDEYTIDIDGESQASGGYVEAKDGIKPYHTRYNLNINSSNETELGQAEVLCPNGQNYWVASRCIGTEGRECRFYVYYINNSKLQSSLMFKSNAQTDSNVSRSLFPVITIDSELIKLDTENEGQYKVSN